MSDNPLLYPLKTDDDPLTISEAEASPPPDPKDQVPPTTLPPSSTTLPSERLPGDPPALWGTPKSAAGIPPRGPAGGKIVPTQAEREAWVKSRTEGGQETIQDWVARNRGVSGAPANQLAVPGRKASPTTVVPDHIAPYLNYWADYYGLDRQLFGALIGHESGFDPNAVGKDKKDTQKGHGLGQIIPGTQAALGVTKPYDINDNLRGSAQYLRQMMDKAQKDGYGVDMGLRYYNSGGNPRVNNAGYADSVLGRYAMMTGKTSPDNPFVVGGALPMTAAYRGGTAGTPGTQRQVQTASLGGPYMPDTGGGGTSDTDKQAKGQEAKDAAQKAIDREKMLFLLGRLAQQKISIPKISPTPADVAATRSQPVDYTRTITSAMDAMPRRQPLESEPVKRSGSR